MRTAFIPLIFGLSSVVYGVSVSAQSQAPQQVFTPYSQPTFSADSDPVINRLRREHAAGDIQVVRLNVEALTNASANSERSFSFGGVTFNSVTQQTTKLANGPIVWKGTIPANDPALPAGNATLVIRGQTATGTISTPDGRRFQVRPISSDATAIIQLNYARLPQEEPASHPAISGPQSPTFNESGPAPAANAADIVPTVDLLVVYSKSAETASGGIESLIELAVIETNDSFVNSGVSARVRVVATMATTIAETGKPYDAIMADLVKDSSINARRETAYADVVIMLVNQNDYCGLADDINATPDKAYVLVHYGCATGYYSFGHEIGHLIGARHNVEADPTMSPYPNGHGLSLASHFRTVMGYACTSTPCEPRIPYFSNPNVLYNGSTTGNATTANNARVWNERAAEVAAFR